MTAKPLASARLVWADAYFGHKRDRFLSCGDVWWLERGPQSELRVACSGCNLRWCPKCRSRCYAKQMYFIKSLTKHISDDRRKFITLTLKSNDAPLVQQLDHLTASFRRLRQTRLWKSKVKYGVGVIEITWSNARRQWHPHIHIVCDSDFVPHTALSKTWCRCTNGSFVVDIRPLRGSNCSGYLCKYLSKLPDILKWSNPKKLASEVVKASYKRRYVIRFGSIPDLPVEPHISNEWTPICCFDTLCRCVKRDEPWAVKLLHEVALVLGSNVVSNIMNGGRDP